VIVQIQHFGSTEQVFDVESGDFELIHWQGSPVDSKGCGTGTENDVDQNQGSSAENGNARQHGIGLLGSSVAHWECIGFGHCNTKMNGKIKGK
jgi:hypothetical protein